VNAAKAAELTEMLFGLWTQVGPRNQALDGGPDPPMQRSNFKAEKGRPIAIYRDSLP